MRGPRRARRPLVRRVLRPRRRRRRGGRIPVAVARRHRGRRRHVPAKVGRHLDFTQHSSILSRNLTADLPAAEEAVRTEM